MELTNQFFIQLAYALDCGLATVVGLGLAFIV